MPWMLVVTGNNCGHTADIHTIIAQAREWGISDILFLPRSNPRGAKYWKQAKKRMLKPSSADSRLVCVVNGDLVIQSAMDPSTEEMNILFRKYHELDEVSH